MHQLLEIGDYEGRLANAAGEPVAGAEVAVEDLAYESFRVPNRNGIHLPTELAEPWKIKSGADGTFRLTGIPQSGSCGAFKIQTRYFPHFIWRLFSGIPLIFTHTSVADGNWRVPGI